MLASIVTALMPSPDVPAPECARGTDHALVRAACAGDIAAFESLYRHHVGRVRGVIARVIGDHGTRADDLTQDAFVKAWHALSSYRFESTFGTWLHRLAANTALMDVRARRSRPDMDGDDDALDTLVRADSAGHGTALALDLERAVAALPPRARAVLVLYDIEGWTHEEISGELDMAIGTSKAQLHRARSLLRARLGDAA